MKRSVSALSQKFGEEVGALCVVIPAKAGIQNPRYFLDSGSRPRCGLGRNDVPKYAMNFRPRTFRYTVLAVSVLKLTADD